MKKILTIGIALLTLASCDMDFYRSDVMTSNMLKANPDAAVYTTDGIYSLFKDNVEYRGKSIDGMEYARLIFQMTEFRGDNVCLSGETSDPLCQQIRYNDYGAQKANYYMWWIAYKVIYAANSNIEAMPEGASSLSDHMLGENYSSAPSATSTWWNSTPSSMRWAVTTRVWYSALPPTAPKRTGPPSARFTTRSSWTCRRPWN
jgi:hypothetical protein